MRSKWSKCNYKQIRKPLTLLSALALAFLGVVPLLHASQGVVEALQYDAAFSTLVQELGTHINHLRELAKSHRWTLEQQKGSFHQMNEIFTPYVLRKLNSSPTATTKALQSHLNEALVRCISGKSSEEIRKYANPGTFVFVVRQPVDRPKFYIVGLSLMVMHKSTNFIHAFAERGGKYVAVAEAGAELENRNLNGLPLKFFAENEMRFLAFGSVIGNPGAPLRVILYKFDGRNLQTLWQKDDLNRGEVSLQNGTVILKYLDHERYSKRTPPYFVVEKYRQTEAGLELVSEKP